MVSRWRWRRPQPTNLGLYIGCSLVVHASMLLALQWVDPPLELTKTAEPPPIELVDAPKTALDQPPPPETPNRAERNTIAQGRVRPDVPLNLETTRRPTATTTPPAAASQPEPSPIAQATPEPVPSPIAQPTPQPEPHPIAQPTPEPVSSPIAQPPIAQPTPEPIPSPIAQPQPSPIAQPTPEPVAPPLTQPKPQTQPQFLPPRPVQTPIPLASPRSADQPTPVPSPQPKGQASLLGGTLTKDVRQAALDQEANTTRNAPGPTQLAARQDFDLGPYLANLRRRVQEYWRPKAPDQRRQAVIGFTIHRSGEISNLRILQSSGSPQTDAETIWAIQQAAPFGALPEQFPYNQLNVEFTFNIYVNNPVIPSPRNWYGF